MNYIVFFDCKRGLKNFFFRIDNKFRGNVFVFGGCGVLCYRKIDV